MDARRFVMDVYEALLERNGNLHWWPGDTPLEIAVGAILTQNTAWANVEKAISRMKAAGITFTSVDEILAMDTEELAQLIRPSGYYNQKADRLLNFARYIKSNGGSIEDWLSSRGTAELRMELLSLKGIGPETADSILLYAGEHLIFVVDAYTKRLVERCLAPAGVFNSQDYHEIQNFFMELLPEDLGLYRDYHAQIVINGKDYCRKKPLCEKGCPLYEKRLCRGL